MEFKTDEPELLHCPVCIEVYCSPYKCMPCEHSFCELCLRRLAKHNHDHKKDNRCPLCREMISYCKPNAGTETHLLF